MELMETKQVEATKANIEKAVEKIKYFANDKGYQLIGEFKKDGFFTSLFSGSSIKFDSKSQEKECKRYLWRIDSKLGMSNANRFLHFLYKKLYKLDKAPYVEYSERELKIKEAKKAWKKVKLEAEKLQKEYKDTKGDFYKI